MANKYNKLAEIDYINSFSPVAKIVIVRIFLPIVATHFWSLHQLDFNNVFLHSFIDEDLYTVPPNGYTKAKPDRYTNLKGPCMDSKRLLGNGIMSRLHSYNNIALSNQ